MHYMNLVIAMKQSKLSNSYLSSTIILKAKLSTNIQAAKSRLSSYPLIKLLHEGRHPKYLIQTNNPDIFYIVMLKSDSISFTVYSTLSPLYLLKEHMLRVISISSILSDNYLIYANSIFPYLINLLSKQDLIKPEKRYNYSRDSDILLSKRIVNLLSSNKKLSDRLDSLNRNLTNVTSELILSRYDSDSNLKQIALETGLDQIQVSEALKHIQQNGNKLIYNGKGNFNIVRI